jgi:uncharacterized protein YndB with AHSA1/START domain
MLKFLLYGFVGFLLLSVILLVIPAFGAGGFSASSTVTINATPAQIYEDIAAPERWLDWSVWNKKRDESCDHKFSEPKIGKGAKWVWKGAAPPDGLGEGEMEITKASETEGIEYELNFKGFPPMKGMIKLTAKDGKTDVEWSTKGNVGDEYMLKLLTTYGLMESAMVEEYNTSLAKLKERAESRATGADEKK